MSWLGRLFGRRRMTDRKPSAERPCEPNEAVSATEDDEPDLTEVVEVPIEDAIDLHPFQPREVKDVVLAYLDEAWERGFDEVRIIHGRGIGQQRRTVRTVLERDARVVSFSDAGPDRGGWGATVARFAPRDVDSASRRAREEDPAPDGPPARGER